MTATAEVPVVERGSKLKLEKLRQTCLDREADFYDDIVSLKSTRIGSRHGCYRSFVIARTTSGNTSGSEPGRRWKRLQRPAPQTWRVTSSGQSSAGCSRPLSVSSAKSSGR